MVQMRLVQKKQGLATFEFVLNDETLIVKTKSLTGSSSYEIPLIEVDTRTSEYSHFPLLWYLFAAFMFVCTAVTAFGVFGDEELADKAGAGILFVMCASFTMVSAYEAIRRRVDYVVFHSVYGGVKSFHLHRAIPTEQHVREYVEILKEAIVAAKAKHYEPDTD